MTQDEFIAAINVIGFPAQTTEEKRQAGKAIGLSLRAFQRVYYGEQDVPPVLGKLVKLCVKHGINQKDLERL